MSSGGCTSYLFPNISNYNDIFVLTTPSMHIPCLAKRVKYSLTSTGLKYWQACETCFCFVNWVLRNSLMILWPKARISRLSNVPCYSFRIFILNNGEIELAKLIFWCFGMIYLLHFLCVKVFLLFSRRCQLRIEIGHVSLLRKPVTHMVNQKYESMDVYH